MKENERKDELLEEEYEEVNEYLDEEEYEYLDEEEYEEYDEYEEDEEELFEEYLMIDCDADTSIKIINEKIKEFKNNNDDDNKNDESMIVNPFVFAHIINIEKNKNKYIEVKRFLKEISSLSGIGITELKNEYKKSIEKDINNFQIERYINEDPDSSFRFYSRDDNGKLTFREGLVGEEILEEENFLHEDGNIYVYMDGFYQLKSKERIDYLIKEKLGVLEYKKHRHDSVRSYVLSDIKKTNNDVANEKQSRMLQRFINMKNGLLDWEKMELVPHNPNLYSKNQLPIEFNKKANKDFANTFLKQVLPKDSVSTIEEYLGYSLTTKMNEQVALMLTGNGSNGKSVFLEFVGNMIGLNNVSSISLKEFDDDKFKRANLKDKLLNIGADISAKRLDETEIFKKMVSGDRMSGEFKGKDAFSFFPYAKHMYSANNLPSTIEADDAFFRRWMIVPFGANFKGKEDSKIFNKIKKEENLEGLFLIALEGLKRLEKQGHFSESKTMEKMLEIYKDDNRPIKRFIEEKCTIFMDEKEIKENYVEANDLFKEYKDWCEEMNMGSKKYTNFFKEMYRDLPELKDRKKQKRIGNEKPAILEGLILGFPENEEENNNNDVINNVVKMNIK
ncbi:DNA primase family protein [Virgibacillus sp. DJP39]|uniref:DNA primase family protein n=1 Tax=Virgibacillus sp. DJP39 TaxID=3409790 RepID=UPI003BB74267